MAEEAFTAITRSQADLFTGGVGLPDSLPEADFSRFARACEVSLRALLCRSDSVLPGDSHYDSWLMLLSAWIKATYAVNRKGVDRTTSKSVRNFSVSSGNDGRLEIADFYSNQATLISLFSNCGSGVDFQTDLLPLIYAPDSIGTAHNPDLPPIAGGAI